MSKVPFSRVVYALLDTSTAFPYRYLKNFSDLEPGDIKTRMDAWPQVSASRKHQLMKDLEKLSADDTLVSMDDFARAMLDDADDQVRLYAIRMLWESEGRPVTFEGKYWRLVMRSSICRSTTASRRACGSRRTRRACSSSRADTATAGFRPSKRPRKSIARG